MDALFVKNLSSPLGWEELRREEAVTHSWSSEAMLMFQSEAVS